MNFSSLYNNIPGFPSEISKNTIVLRKSVGIYFVPRPANTRLSRALTGETSNARSPRRMKTPAQNGQKTCFHTTQTSTVALFFDQLI